MISIDSRVGSKDLYPLLSARGVPCRLTTLEFGDAAFDWKGPRGRPIPVGIERKTLSDLLTCIKDGRYTGYQLPGMLRTYEFNYLLIEGVYRYSEDGVVESRRGKGWSPVGYGKPTMVADLEHFLTSRETFGGVRILRSTSPRQTALLIHHKYTWGNTKDWVDHRSHLDTDESSETGTRFSALPLAVNFLVASRLEGIGVKKVHAVLRAFPTVEDMIMADEERWAEVVWVDKSGKRHKLGSAIAKKIVEAKGWRN